MSHSLFDDDGDIFDLFPDLNQDGDSDLFDAMLLDDLTSPDGDDTPFPFEDEEDDYGLDTDGDAPLYEEEACAPLTVTLTVSVGEDAPVQKPTPRTRREVAAMIAQETPHLGNTKELLERARFITADEVCAARYLTVSGDYLYAQAVKEHFSLPFSLPDEEHKIITPFDELLRALACVDIPLAMTVWEWCLDTFLPYHRYACYQGALTDAILLCFTDFSDEFVSGILDYSVLHPSFIKKLLMHCQKPPHFTEELVVGMLARGEIELAKTIMSLAFFHREANAYDKICTVGLTIERCHTERTCDALALFCEHLFPLVLQEEDARVRAMIPTWQKNMENA